MNLAQLDDHALILRSRELHGEQRVEVLQVLYRRYYERVGMWCLRVCGDREEAAELAQDVFARVHSRIDGFRMESAFSTWIYRVTRNLAIDRGLARARGAATPLEDAPEPRDPRPGTDELMARREVVDRFSAAVANDLDPLEARVIFLHYVEGVRLSDLTDTLGLTNVSGAKAYVVSAKRKLGRTFGRWFSSYCVDDTRSAP